MDKVYADLVRRGLKTLEQVPAPLRDAVRAILEPESTSPENDLRG